MPREHFVLKVDGLEAGKLGKHKDLSELEEDQIVLARSEHPQNLLSDSWIRLQPFSDPD